MLKDDASDTVKALKELILRKYSDLSGDKQSIDAILQIEI